MISCHGNFSKEACSTSVARLVPQEKHYRGYWKNGGHRNTGGKVFALAMGTPMAEPLLATNMSVAAIFFQT